MVHIESECYILTTVLFIIFLIYLNSTYMQIDYFGSGPEIFLQEGEGESIYYDNQKLEAVHRIIDLPTIYDV